MHVYIVEHYIYIYIERDREPPCQITCMQLVCPKITKSVDYTTCVPNLHDMCMHIDTASSRHVHAHRHYCRVRWCLHVCAFKIKVVPLVQISSKPAARSTFHWRFPLSNVSERNRWVRL
jgi:hypothetical protein